MAGPRAARTTRDHVGTAGPDWFEASRGPDGKIAFTPREIDDQSGIGTQFVVADFNGDGLLDVVTSNKKGVFLLEQVGR
jgi:hypothetical protein